MKEERRSDALFLERADNEIVSAARKFPADVTLSAQAKVHANDLCCGRADFVRYVDVSANGAKRTQ
jgi:hypothetical protein